MLFLHWWAFINHCLLQTPWTNAIEKNEGLFPSHSGVCYSQAETISRIFKGKGQSLSQISQDHKKWYKRNHVIEYCVHVHMLPSTSMHHPRHTHTDCPVLCQPDQYFRHKWGELKGREIHIEVWKHSRKKKTDPFKSTNTPNKSWWAWWGDCSSFWQLRNYSLNRTTTFFRNRHSICKTITALGITAGRSPGYMCHNPLVRRCIWATWGLLKPSTTYPDHFSQGLPRVVIDCF